MRTGPVALGNVENKSGSQNLKMGLGSLGTAQN
jgi:hypothetical protein